MNGLDDEFHKQQRQPITVFLMFHCCFRMVSSTKAETENRTKTLRTKCYYTDVSCKEKNIYLWHGFRQGRLNLRVDAYVSLCVLP